MNKTSELEQKLSGLFRRRNSGIKFGLDVQSALMREMGDPQNRYAVIHVAGTNGKGSVCAMLSAMLSCAGVRTGLYVSPHLVAFNERMSVNGKHVTDSELLSLSELVDAAVKDAERECGRDVTFFEYSTALAMKFFEQQSVQIAVLETGMGGRLDATNIVTPLVSVITRISIDHSDFLGQDLTAIAGEKAGIIKSGRPVVCGAMPEEAKAVLRRKASGMGCSFRDAEETVSASLNRISLEGQKIELSSAEADYGRINMKLIGAHQVENAATAVAALEEAERAMGVEFDADVVKQGLKSVSWPGRCQVLSEDPPVILDGAHNAGGSLALGETLKKMIGAKPLGLVIGMCGDKDISAFLESFHGVRKIWAVTISNERAVSGEELAKVAAARGIDAQPVVLAKGLADAEKWAKSCGGAVCVTGSLFLAGEVLEIINNEQR